MAARNDQNRSKCYFEQWMSTQKNDLSELLQALTTTTTAPTSTDGQLSQLVEKNIKHFQEYKDGRSNLARQDVFPFFAPSWCTSFENSLLWIGGCRPSLFFRLLYALCSLGIEPQLAEFLEGLTTSNLVGGDLSGGQLCFIDILHCKTVREEVKMTSKWASLQENMADEPLAIIASKSSGVDCKTSKETDEVVDEQEREMTSIMEEADELRMRTLKELLSILKPLQGVMFLAAGKKLNLCIHEWGKDRDHLHAICRGISKLAVGYCLGHTIAMRFRRKKDVQKLTNKQATRKFSGKDMLH